MSPALTDESARPPTPPPLPPQSSYGVQLPKPHFKVAEKASGFWEKFKYAQGAFNDAPISGVPIDPLAPKTGPHFFYGSLMDPALLMEILGLEETPTLQRATVIGYSCRLWGQYPALVNGPEGGVVEGAMYDVQTEKHAARLAEYETKAYMAVPCQINLVGRDEPAKVFGTTFRYVGPDIDLSEGEFDLKTWLRHMGRECVAV